MLLSERNLGECFGIFHSFTHFPAEDHDVTLFSKGEDKDGKYFVVESQGGYRTKLTSDIDTFMI